MTLKEQIKQYTHIDLSLLHELVKPTDIIIVLSLLLIARLICRIARLIYRSKKRKPKKN